VSRQLPGAPHEVLLVLDGTTGQNAIAQAEAFKKTVQCTGVIMTKLDGTAKGGSLFAIKQKLALPVKFIGVGEKLDDLEPFDADAVEKAVAGSNVVFHLAALASVQRSVERPGDTHAVCATGTLNVLDAARKNGVRRVVYAGSASAYGIPGADVQTEREPLQPL